MAPRGLRALSLFAFWLTTGWIILLVAGMASGDPLMIGAVARMPNKSPTLLFFLIYIDAALLTCVAASLFAGLYLLVCEREPLWAAVGLVFVPVYLGLNLVSYLSQIVLVPALLRLCGDPALGSMAQWWLGQVQHSAPGSAIGFANALAYVALGVPSVVYGLAMRPRSRAWAATSALLIGSAIADLVGFVGLAAASQVLSSGLLVGGALFWVALFSMARALGQETRRGAREASSA